MFLFVVTTVVHLYAFFFFFLMIFVYQGKILQGIREVHPRYAEWLSIDTNRRVSRY